MTTETATFLLRFQPTICVAAPAVLNAFFNATGKRLRSVPLKNHGIQLV